MIRNIIFDLGGVIITLSHDEAVRRFQQLGLKDAPQQLDPYTQGGIF
jgi:putative hydrolase of the HAD superfamily